MAFELSSTAFHQDEQIPARYSCEGDDVSPPLAWTGPPAGTKAYALVVDDPDAPSGTFTHWLLADIAAEEHAIAEGQSAGIPGKNDFRRVGYRGPCPPKGHGRHHYRFHLHALSGPLGLTKGFNRRSVDAALRGRILGTAMLNGWYERG
jgi:Raf kinase inhibitor-like YbhB/YbcL family protein